MWNLIVIGILTIWPEIHSSSIQRVRNKLSLVSLPVPKSLGDDAILNLPFIQFVLNLCEHVYW